MRRTGWNVGETGSAMLWLIAGTDGENRVGASQSEACWRVRPGAGGSDVGTGEVIPVGRRRPMPAPVRPYQTPTFDYGDFGTCLVRGEMEMVALTDARIPWTIGKIGRRRLLILCTDPARAVRRDSPLAVAHRPGLAQGVGNGCHHGGHEAARECRRDAGEAEVARAISGRGARRAPAGPDRGVEAGQAPARHVIEAMTRGRIEAAKRRKGE
jgi:hypothetical protein